MERNPGTTALDRVLLSVAPRFALNRIRARLAVDLMQRHYEAASVGRRTSNWSRRISDANAAAGAALATLRAHSHDLVRNTGWAKNARRVIGRNVIGWGITPKPVAPVNKAGLAEAWRAWAGSTECDAAGRLTFAGLQKLAINSIFEGGEVLIRRRWRRPSDGLSLPMQLQVLEPDFIDTNKHRIQGQQGGVTIYGIEFDAIGRRVAYWLFDEHPGSSLLYNPVSSRIPASEVIHAYDVERAGQDRGVPWLSAAIVKMKDLDEFEDAQLMQQKIAVLLAGFIENDLDGAPVELGAVGTPPGGQAPGPTDPRISVLEPGLVQELKPGQKVTFSNPPSVTNEGFRVGTLRAIAAAVGVTYEDLTGDYSQVNFSSARMSRLAHWGNVYDWQWNMIIPQLCDPAWRWAMEAAAFAGILPADKLPRAEWTPMPMPLTDPDKEARANTMMIRSGQKTLSEVIREMGRDPDVHLEEYASDMAKLDAKGIWLDSDVRRVSQAGLIQPRAGAGGNGAANGSGDGATDAAEGGSGDGAAAAAE